MWPSSSTWFIWHLLQIFACISSLPLVLLTFMGSVSGSACMNLSFSPGFSPLCVHSQLLLCLDLRGVTNAFPMFWHSSWFSNVLITSSLLLVEFCNSRHTSLSLYMGVRASPVYWAILSFEIFILVAAFALVIIVVVRRSGMLNPFRWCIQVLLVHVGRCKILFTYFRIIQLIFLASSNPWSLNLNWRWILAAITCLIASTFWIGFRCTFERFSRYLFQSSLGSLTVPSGCISTPRYFTRSLKVIDGIFSVPHCVWDFGITFIDFFFGTGTTHRLAHFPAFACNLFPSKNSLLASINIYIWILSSVSNTRSFAKAMQHSSSSLILIPTFNFLSFSINSSMIKLNSNGDSGHPFITPALILICLVTFPPTDILVVAPLYIFITASLTCSVMPFLRKPLSMLLWETVSKALAKSMNTRLYSFPLFRFCLIISWRILTFSKHPSTGTKPFCHSSNVMFALNLLSHNLLWWYDQLRPS